MNRQAQLIMVYLMLMNAVAIVLDNIGFTDEMDVDVHLSATSHFQSAAEAVDDFDLDGGFLETLFGIYDAAYSTMAGVVTSVYAGPEMLVGLGVPGEIVEPFEIILIVLVGFAIIYYASGR